ncbi:MAG: TPR end-of-group domain-containing protein, partial [Povalibacter sp.]
VYHSHEWTVGGPIYYYGFAAVYAHMLFLSGEVARGRQLAKALLVRMDADEIGRPAHWFSRDRAALLALLGENDRALEELAASQALNQWTHWWYTAQMDPIFEPLHDDPRFKKLVDAASRHRAEQRALLDDMRRRGEVPVRVSALAQLKSNPQ